VCADALLKFQVPARKCDLDLCEDRVGIDVRKSPHGSVVCGALQRSGYIDKQVGAAQYVESLRVRHAEPTRLDRKPIRPTIRQSEAFHHARKMPDVRRAIVRDPVVSRRATVEGIRTLPRILLS